MNKTLIAFVLAGAALSSSHVWASGFETKPVENRQNSDFIAGKKAIDARNWDAAVKSFNRAVKSDPDNPDIYNYLGYAYRKLNVRDLSFENYNRALQIDPNHRGANEYIGIAYLKNGDLASAQKHLDRLNTICGADCEETKDLQQAVSAYQNGQPFTW